MHDLLQQADRLLRWNRQLKKSLPRQLAASVRLCNIRKNGVAVIAVPTQSVASQVYLHQTRLLQALQALQLPVTRISLRIVPDSVADPDTRRALPVIWQQAEATRR